MQIFISKVGAPNFRQINLSILKIVHPQDGNSTLSVKGDVRTIRCCLKNIPQPHHLPRLRHDPDAGSLLPLRVPAGDAACEQLVQEGGAQLLRGGDDGLCTLNGLVDGVQHCSDGSLLR